MQLKNEIKNFKALLFDFDGTLVDSMRYWTEKMYNILNVCGIAIPEGLVETITPLGDVGTARYYKETLGVPFGVEEMVGMMDDYALDKYKSVVEGKPYVRELLDALAAAGIKSYILTASPRRMYQPCLERLGLMECFADTWSCEDFGTVKSDVAIYSAAAKAMGISEGEYAFVDDNCQALATAQKAGVYTIGVFDDFSAALESKTRAASDLYIGSFADLFEENK